MIGIKNIVKAYEEITRLGVNVEIYEHDRITTIDFLINGDSIQAHIRFLKDEHKELFQSGDGEKIKSIIESMGKPKQIEYLV